MALKSIDHFELVVADLDRTLSFYRNLGVETAEAIFPNSGRRRVFLNIGDSQQVNLVTPQDVAALGRTVLPGGGHVCLIWEGTVDEVAEQLARAGITPRRGPVQAPGARGQGTSLYFTDPDANSIEIMVYPPSA